MPEKPLFCIGLGCMIFGHDIDETACAALLDHSFARIVRQSDTTVAQRPPEVRLDTQEKALDTPPRADRIWVVLSRIHMMIAQLFRVRLILLCFWLTSVSALCSSLTIITHGFQQGDTPSDVPWVNAMASAINGRIGGNAELWNLTLLQDASGRLYVSQSMEGVPVTESSNRTGAVICKFHWKALAVSRLTLGQPEPNTGEVANALARFLLERQSTPEVLENPVHLIGHSRGGGVMCEVASLLGAQGIWVDHVTTLDPQPVSSFGDPPAKLVETIKFADNYRQGIGPLLDGVPRGEVLEGAWNRSLNTPLTWFSMYPTTVLGGGAHSDVHLWYFGTINTANGASNGEYALTEFVRKLWYDEADAEGGKTGYFLSRLGDGAANRSSSKHKAGFGGLDRTLLSPRLPSSRTWPNILDAETESKGSGTYETYVDHQDADSPVTLRIYLDSDENVFNGRVDSPVAERFVPVMGEPAHPWGTLMSWSALGIVTGTYKICVEVDDGTHKRHFYEKTPISVINNGGTPPTSVPPSAPTDLTGVALSPNSIRLAWKPFTQTASTRIRYSLTGGSPWTVMRPDQATGTTELNVNGVKAATAYHFQAAAVHGQHVVWSDEISSVITPGIPTTSGYTLTVNAQNASTSASLSAACWSFVETTSEREQTTPFTRSAAKNQMITISAPMTLSGGLRFQRFQLNGSPYGNASMANVQMDGPYTLTAVYDTTTPGPRALTGLTIEGGTSVDERSALTLRARASYSDGSSELVKAAWSDNSSDASVSSAGVLDADDVSSDTSVTVTASFTAGGVNRSDTHNVTIRNKVSATTYSLSLSAANGHITATPQLSRYEAGTVVTLTAYPDADHIVGAWGGDASGSGRSVTVRMDRNRSVTHSFTFDARTADVVVTCLPAAAAADGAAYKLRNSRTALSNWKPSRERVGSWGSGECTITFKDLPGWITPEPMVVNIEGGGQRDFSATYREVMGTVQVSIQPQDVVSAGARWKLDGGTWQESGTALADVTPGSHRLEFKTVTGWSSPAIQDITVIRGAAAVMNESYQPAAGQPVIANVSPSFGTPDGGTVITIDGANFKPGAAVKFGTRSAVTTFVSSTRLTAVLPASPTYGSVSVAVTSVGQTTTKPGGFTYNIPLGMNMTQLGQIGGSVQAVTAVGNMVYYGEGNSLVAADFSNAAAPVVRGRLPLPGMVSDIEMSGNIAVVANRQFGIQLVDVSNPSSMKLLGLYDTPGTAMRVAVRGKLAYVADSLTLEIIDFTNPAIPLRKASVTPPDNPRDVAVTTVGSKTIACVAADTAGVLVYDVTLPSSASLLSSMGAGQDNDDVAVDGSRVLVLGADSALQLFDIAQPSNPVLVCPVITNTFGHPFRLRGNLVYTCQSQVKIWDVSNPITPSQIGWHSLDGFSRGMAISGNYLYVANDAAGLSSINIGTPTSPVLTATLNEGFKADDIAISGTKLGVAIQGSSWSRTAFPALALIDVGNPRNPQRQGTALSQYGIDQLISSGANGLAAAAWLATTLFDISNPAFPSQTASQLTDRESYGITMFGANLLVAGQSSVANGERPILTLLNGANPASSPISTIELGSTLGSAYGPSAFGTTGYVFQLQSGLRVLNYSTPSSPSIIGSYNWSGCSVIESATSQDGRYVFAADQNGGLRIFDCQNPSSPQLIATFNRDGGNAKAVKVQNHLVFYADVRGINVLDCTLPANPALVASYDSPGSPTGIAVNGTTVYVADGDGGVLILELGDVSKPLVQITAPTSNSSLEVTTPSISLGGTASDAQGIRRVTWTNNRGGGGTATGTTTWSVASVAIQPGSNLITVFAEDTTGNIAEDTLTVIKPTVDSQAPQLTILSPTSKTSWITSDSTIDLSGSCADNVGVTQISWGSSTGDTGNGTVSGLTWSIVGVPLVDGPNTITVKAHDLVGNTRSDVLTVHRAPPDVEAPAISIQFPSTGQSFVTTSTKLLLGGEAADDRGIKEVRWSNDRGGSGTASGRTSWQAGNVPLLPGVNILTVTVEDDAGNRGTDELTVTCNPPVPLSQRPKIVFSSPASSARLESPAVNASGTATGQKPIVEVLYQLNDSPWSLANGTSSWSVTLNPPVGLNTLRVKAVDDAGVESVVAVRNFTRVQKLPLPLSIVGPGTLKYGGFSSLSALEVGKTYTVTALPNSGAIFAGWSGSLSSPSKTLSFVMSEDLSLTATFIANPFPALAGSYLGLITADPPGHDSGGLARLTLTPTGSYTGNITLGSRPTTVAGNFDSEGRWLGQVARSRLPRLALHFDLGIAAGMAGKLTGVVSDGVFTSTLHLERGRSTGLAGRYTMVFDKGAAPLPPAYGWGTVQVTSGGSVTWSGRLADASVVTQSSLLWQDGSWPLHVRTHSLKASAVGMVFLSLGTTALDVDGELLWIKPVTSGAYLPGAWTGIVPVLGSRYVAPPASPMAIGGLAATGDNLHVDWASSTFVNPGMSDARLDAKHKLTFALPGNSGTITATTGVIQGTLKHPDSAAKLGFSGVVLQKQRLGRGIFPLPASSGSVEVQPLGSSPSYLISTNASPAPGGSVSGAGTYTAGAKVTVSATPATGYDFIHWMENGAEISTNRSLSFTASANRDIAAEFVASASMTITALASPAGGGTITGAGSYYVGDLATLAATAAPGYVFRHWLEDGEPVSNNANISFVVSSSRTFTAQFEATVPANITDDFNRPDALNVANGWEDSAAVVGAGWTDTNVLTGTLSLANNRVVNSNTSGVAGIHRSFDHSPGGIRLEATFTHKNGNGSLEYRHMHCLGIRSNGSIGDGLAIFFSRSDQSTNNSRITLYDGTTVVGQINSTFQFKEAIRAEVDFNVDGSVHVHVFDAAAPTTNHNLDFPARTINATGSRVIFVTEGNPGLLRSSIDDVEVTRF